MEGCAKGDPLFEIIAGTPASQSSSDSLWVGCLLGVLRDGCDSVETWRPGIMLLGNTTPWSTFPIVFLR